MKDAEDLAKLFNGGIPVGVKGGSHYIYGRHFNPTVYPKLEKFITYSGIITWT